MRLDEFIKEAPTTFFVMNFIFIERYKNLIKHTSHINLKIFPTLTFIHFVCNLQINSFSRNLFPQHRTLFDKAAHTAPFDDFKIVYQTHIFRNILFASQSEIDQPHMFP